MWYIPDLSLTRFDDRANGYSRGEGASVMVLKSLDDAIRDGYVRLSSVLNMLTLTNSGTRSVL